MTDATEGLQEQGGRCLSAEDGSLDPQGAEEAFEMDGLGSIAAARVIFGALVGSAGQEEVLFFTEALVDDVRDEGGHFALDDAPKDAGLDGLPNLAAGRAIDLLLKKLGR